MAAKDKWMWSAIRACVAALAFALPPAHGQDAELNKLYGESRVLEGQGDYRGAAEKLKRAFDLAEKTLGPEHKTTAGFAAELGLMHTRLGEYAIAERLFLRALATREKVFPREHPAIAVVLNRLGLVYTQQHRPAEAEAAYRRALTIFEAAFGSEPRDVTVDTLNNLAVLYTNQGKYAQAIPLFERALTMSEKRVPPDNDSTGRFLDNLAMVHAHTGNFAKAEEMMNRALALKEKSLPANHPSIAESLAALAEVLRTKGEFARAEQLQRRVLAVLEKSLGANNPEYATKLSNLARVYMAQGRYQEAEALFTRALEISEAALGRDHPQVARMLSYLGTVYSERNQSDLAQALFERALAVSEKALGPQHEQVALNLDNLASVLPPGDPRQQALYQRALRIREHAFGPDHPAVASSLYRLGALYFLREDYAGAEPLYRRALAIFERTLGSQHPGGALITADLARVYHEQKRFREAEPLYKSAVALNEKALGASHPQLALTRANLAAMYDVSGRPVEALATTRRATAIYRGRMVSGGMDDAAVREALPYRQALNNHLSLLRRNAGKEDVTKVTEEAFEVGQLVEASGTAAALAKMAARFASDNDAMAKLIRQKQDATERRNLEDARLLRAAAQLPEQRDAAAESRSRAEVARLQREIASLDDELARRFPQYQQLSRPEPVPAKQVQDLLAPGEAMLVYSIDTTSFLWILKRDGITLLELAIDPDRVAKQVAQVRSEMDIDARGIAKPVSLAVLHVLYEKLVGPAVSQLGEVKHLIVVPSGPLQSLPFSMLVASPPPRGQGGDMDYATVDWLARRYAISVLPSVGAIQALRHFARPASASRPFAGFGDPLIGTTSGPSRHAAARLSVRQVFSRKASVSSPEVADVEEIRNAPRLPETADELRAMARVLKSGTEALWLQDRATEANVKSLDLAQYRVLAFATHGVMAGELKGIGEAGLVLTPPAKASIADDGYLSASEVARLKLNADWVLLSACNTAAPDGTPGAEGLSGLAKAFFYAGARSLLVSHWPVASEATVPLTTRMLAEFEAHPEAGKAEAHRKAMLALIDAPAPAPYTHPIFWAPFVVVGEGGSDRRSAKGDRTR
jgi:CHAT domain-containing protein/Tfp pilus assembly protein PilF